METQEIKIYLSSSQVEELCSYKIIIISVDQLEIKRASKWRGFSVIVANEKILKEGDKVIVLFSSISAFEIPKSEEKLFKNSLRIPPGLVKLTARKIPEDEGDENAPVNHEVFGNADSSIYPLFSKLRRALTQLILYGYRNNKEGGLRELEIFVNNLLNSTTFPFQLISTIREESTFPLYEGGNPNTVYSDSDLVLFWLGVFVVDHAPELDSQTDKDQVLLKEWLRSFRGCSVDNLKDYSRNFNDVPKQFGFFVPVFIGYYFAAMVSGKVGCDERISAHIENALKETSIERNRFEILFWGVFFQAFFLEDVDYIYPNPLIQTDFYDMEVLAVFLSKTILKVDQNLEASESNICKFHFKSFDIDKLVISYHELKEIALKCPRVLNNTESEIYDLFSNSLLFRDNRNTIGFINREFGANYIKLRTDRWESSRSYSPDSITYFGDITQAEKDKIQIHLKRNVKPLKKLINKEKKVVVGFINQSDLNSDCWAVYRDIIRAKKTNIEELVFVWIVSEDISTIQSTEFAILKEEFTRKLRSEFGINATLIVKNIFDHRNDIEVIRNLKLALKNFTLGNIELVDHELKLEYAAWLIDATNEYVIRLDNKDYFAFVA